MLIRDITATWVECNSLTHSDHDQLLRALVGYMTKYGDTGMTESIMHNTTVHAVMQVFAAVDGDEEPQWATLFVEPLMGEYQTLNILSCYCVP